MLKIAIISESDFTVQGHGVHTAFVETVNGLKQRDDIVVTTNTWSSADIRHIHTVGPYSFAQLLFGRGKKIVSAHVVPESFVGSLAGARYWLPLARWYLRWFYNRAAMVIAVSDATKQQLQAMGVSKPIEVIYNMIDGSKYAADAATKSQVRAKLGYKEDDWIVVSSGQVQPRKRIDTFVAIAKLCPDMKFIWIGGIPFKNAAADFQGMKNIISAAPKNVHFTGVMSLDDVRQFYWAADVFVSTSDQETFGLSIIEAAASGLPVVLRDIHDYDSTFRVDATTCSSDDEFAAAVRNLRSDRQLYARKQTAARRIAERFDSETISKNLVSLYERVLGSA